MVKRNWNIAAYEILEVLPSALFVIAVFIYIIVVLSLKYCCKQKVGEKLCKWTLKGLHGAAASIFGGKLGLLREEPYDPVTDNDGNPITYVHNKKVNSKFLISFGFFSFILLVLSMTTFWDVFLF